MVHRLLKLECTQLQFLETKINCITQKKQVLIWSDFIISMRIIPVDWHENYASIHTHTHTHVWFLKFINITFKLFLSFIVFLSNYYYYYDCCRCCSNFYKSFSFHNDSLNENNHHLWNEWLLLNYYRMLIGWLRENRNLIFYYIFLIWYSYFFFDFRFNSRLCSRLGNEKLPSIMRKNLKKKKMIMRISENYISLHKKWIVLCVCVGFFFVRNSMDSHFVGTFIAPCERTYLHIV